MKTSLLRIVYFVIITLLFALGFYRNQWQAVDTYQLQYRRNVSEVLVVGRLVKSRQDGAFSAGGLLGLGDVSDYSVESKVIKNQYNKYYKDQNFSQFWTYDSNPGFQAVTFSIFDALTDFAPMTNITIFRMSVSLFLSITLALLCLWFENEIGWLASLLVVFFILASRWLVLLGGNIYWSLWSFYLPVTFLSFFLKRYEDKQEYPSSVTIMIVFFLSLVKILFSGFEFITSSLLMFAVPFVYYAVLNKWGWNLFLRRMLGLGVSLMSSVMAGLLILGLQIRSVLGNYQDVLNYLIFTWNKRTYGHDALLGSPSAASLNPVRKELGVWGTYLNGYAFSLSTHLRINSFILKDIVDGQYLFLIILFVLATIIFLIAHPPSEKTVTSRTGVALIIAFWFSILGPLSWFVVFRDHTQHTLLDFIVWQMPYTLYGFALVGFVASHVRKTVPAKV